MVCVHAIYLHACSSRRRGSSLQRSSRCTAASGGASVPRRASCWMQQVMVSSSSDRGKGSSMQWTPSKCGSEASHADRCVQSVCQSQLASTTPQHLFTAYALRLFGGSLLHAGSAAPGSSEAQHSPPPNYFHLCRLPAAARLPRQRHRRLRHLPAVGLSLPHLRERGPTADFATGL